MPGEPLGAARGVVQEGAAGIESFAHVLGSRRVGPRGIARALPDVRDGCVELHAALGRLLEAIRAELDADAEAADIAGAALASAAQEVARLEQGLAVRGVIDARQRLALEASVRRAARELDVALNLVDLVSATLSLRPTPLDLLDVLRARSAAVAQGQPVVRVTAAFAGRADGLEADARVVGGLVELAVALVHASGVARPQLDVSAAPGGRVTLRVSEPRAGGPQPMALDLPLREGGDRARAVARVAARRAGIELVVDAGGRAATLSI